MFREATFEVSPIIRQRKLLCRAYLKEIYSDGNKKLTISFIDGNKFFCFRPGSHISGKYA